MSIIPNTTQVPNLYFDKIMHLLDEGEIKTLLYAVRRTMGFHKQSDRISTSQFMNGNGRLGKDGEPVEFGTGLTKTTQLKCCQSLVDFGILVEIAPNDPSRNEGKEWALQLDAGLIRFDALFGRKNSRSSTAKKRTKKARAAAAEKHSTGLLDRPAEDGIPGLLDRPVGNNGTGLSNRPVPGLSNRPMTGLLDRHTEIKGRNKDRNKGNSPITTPTSNGHNLQIDDVDGDLRKEELVLPLILSDEATLATAVADWMGFTGDITYEMQQHSIIPVVLLAWAFWVKAEGSKCRNPVGVCRSKWTGNGRRGPELPPYRWLELARAWLAMNDQERLTLLETGGMSHMLPLEFPFPDVMAAFADLYRATSGQPIPPSLVPDDPDVHVSPAPPAGAAEVDTAVDEPEPSAPLGLTGESVATVDGIWTMLTTNQHNPGTKMWLKSTKLLVDTAAKTAVIVVINSYAADWINNRLLDYINREWEMYVKHMDADAGQPWCNLVITGAAEAAHLLVA